MDSSIDRMRVLDLLDRMAAMVNRAARLFPQAAKQYDPAQALPSDSMLALERALHVALQSMLDIASMLLSCADRAQVRSHREALEVLATRGVLAPDRVGTYVAMASFRNVLAHEYDGLDYERILGLADHLDDFEAFARDVVAHLDREDDMRFVDGG